MRKILLLFALITVSILNAQENLPWDHIWQYDKGDNEYHRNDWTAPIWGFRTRIEFSYYGEDFDYSFPIFLPSPFYSGIEFNYCDLFYDFTYVDPDGILSDIAHGADSDFIPVEKGGDWVLLTAYLGDGSKELLDIIEIDTSAMHQDLNIPLVVLYNIRTGIIRYMYFHLLYLTENITKEMLDFLALLGVDFDFPLPVFPYELNYEGLNIEAKEPNAITLNVSAKSNTAVLAASYFNQLGVRGLDQINTTVQHETKIARIMKSGGLWYYMDVVTGYDPRSQNANNTLSFSAYGTVDAKVTAVINRKKVLDFVINKTTGGNNNSKIKMSFHKHAFEVYHSDELMFSSFDNIEPWLTKNEFEERIKKQIEYHYNTQENRFILSSIKKIGNYFLGLFDKVIIWGINTFVLNEFLVVKISEFTISQPGATQTPLPDIILPDYNQKLGTISVQNSPKFQRKKVNSKK
ncbi:MAG: hypothetical protein FWG98_09870 [Candidatus Cloacimonetes bacterium]|nr:hypothetical protein [Candidatus Cloacimonadota bacterium]